MIKVDSKGRGSSLKESLKEYTLLFVALTQYRLSVNFLSLIL
jgi:hypothetical protein